MIRKYVLKFTGILSLAILFTLTAPSQITLNLEGSSTVDLGNELDYLSSELRLYSWIKVNKNIDLEILALSVDNAIGQILAGPSVPLFGKVRFTGQIGLVTNAKNPLRMAATLSYFVPEFLGVMIYEWGPETSYFYKYLFLYTLNRWDLGIRGQRFRNNGIFFGYRLTDILQVYLHPGYDFEFDRTTLAIGMSATFKSR